MPSVLVMLQTHGLTRRFGDVRAVDEVSFEVPRGRLTGFVGGNGAGKTTTMRMIMGLLAIDAGEVTLDGEPLTTQRRRRFGYMPEERGLYPKQKVLDQLVYLAELSGVPAPTARRSAGEHLERFGLADRGGDRLEKLSLGNQQRVQIIASLLHDPEVLVLDEPFSGLDPGAVDSMADLLREGAAASAPVLFSSHQLDLVERLCDHLVVLARGRVVAHGTVEELRRRGPQRLRLVTDRDAGWVRDQPGWVVIDVDGPTALVEPQRPEDLPALRRRLVDAVLDRAELVELSAVHVPLSDVYREVTA